MSRYALIQDSRAHEILDTDRRIKDLFHPGLTWVDITNQKPQPEVGWVFSGGAWSEPPPPVIPAAHLVYLTLDRGCEIESGVFACHELDQAKLKAELIYVQAAGKFTNGETTKVWHDLSGKAHTFSTTDFVPFAEKINRWVDAVTAWAHAGGTGDPPKP